MITENRFPLLKKIFFFFLAKMKEKYLFSYYKKQNIFFLVILKWDIFKKSVEMLTCIKSNFISKQLWFQNKANSFLYWKSCFILIFFRYINSPSKFKLLLRSVSLSQTIHGQGNYWPLRRHAYLLAKAIIQYTVVIFSMAHLPVGN